MSFVSYAQNLEDVILWRALKHVRDGYYIDIGAWSPDLDSVTRGFYEKGWHGINVEPNHALHAELVQRRPLDTNLCMAVSDSCGQLPMHFLSNSGLSTLDEAIARQHVAAGQAVDQVSHVSVTTLEQLWKHHVSADQAVHFLKVDVEGLEGSVLRGNDWILNRPWIVVVEATLPMTQETSHHEWEQLLVCAAYEYVYADGINRFYLAKEHSALKAFFTYPPNYFDGYVLGSSEQLKLQIEKLTSWLSASQILAKNLETDRDSSVRRAQDTEGKIAQMQTDAVTLEMQLAVMVRRSTKAEAHIQTMLKSTSWRITLPMRAAKQVLLAVCASVKEGIRRTASSYLGLFGRGRLARAIESMAQDQSEDAFNSHEVPVSESHLTREGMKNHVALLRAVPLPEKKSG